MSWIVGDSVTDSLLQSLEILVEESLIFEEHSASLLYTSVGWGNKYEEVSSQLDCVEACMCSTQDL